MNILARFGLSLFLVMIVSLLLYIYTPEPSINDAVLVSILSIIGVICLVIGDEYEKR